MLEKDNNIDYDLSTHADIEKISFYPNEKEVLFFPFSSFEIKEIKKVNDRYEIKLLYLGKYIKKLEKNKNNNNIIPNSEFKKQIIESGLIKKVDNTPKNILNKYNEYKKEINNNKDIISKIINQNNKNEENKKEETTKNEIKCIYYKKKIEINLLHDYSLNADDWKDEEEKK